MRMSDILTTKLQVIQFVGEIPTEQKGIELCESEAAVGGWGPLFFVVSSVSSCDKAEII